MRYTVTRDWTASHEAPIRVRAGEALALSGRSTDWDGHTWLWARDPAGREGWIPDNLAEMPDGGGDVVRARADYSAVELTCRAGQTLTALQETHGWALCRSPGGDAGWVPLSHLASLER